MNKKISLGAAVAFMVVVAGITFCITMMVSFNHFNTMVLNVKAREEMYKKIADVDREARQNFSGVIDEEYLLDMASAGYVRGLNDKYSYYMSKNQYEQRMKDLSGKEVGIGITADKDDSGYLKVKKVLAGSPAEVEGVMKGDYIVSIAGNDLKTISNDNAQRLMKGEVGTKVSIVYRRDGVDTTKDIIRTDITVPTVEFKMLEDNAVITILSFDKLTNSHFQDAVDKAVKQDAKAIIFDLRNCSGDSIESVSAMLNTLLPVGEMGTIIDNNGNTTKVGLSDKFEIDLPMATVVNNKTMGVSELFVAALRDFNKANSVGTTTYGKGLLQSVIQLTDGSAINITTKKMLPPSGTDFNEVGVKPDYEVKLSSELESRIDEITEQEDSQLQKAIDVVNSKKLNS